MTRTCTRCGHERNLDTDYYRRGDGSLNPWCKECYREWYRARGGYTTTRTVQCEWCDGEFTTPYQRTRYCSSGCKGSARARRRKKGVAVARKPDRQCVHCGAAMPRKMRADARFCSDACNSAAHQVTRKMAKRAGADRSSVLVSRAAIADRDGWRCGICGGKVARGKKYPDPMCASIDHIIPLSHGGGNGAENLRLTHLRCNVTRRDRATDDQLMLVG